MTLIFVELLVEGLRLGFRVLNLDYDLCPCPRRPHEEFFPILFIMTHRVICGTGETIAWLYAPGNQLGEDVLAYNCTYRLQTGMWRTLNRPSCSRPLL